MKKTISTWSWALLLALCVGFSSCSKDDKKIEEEVFGKWQLIESSDANLTDCDFQGWLEINSNGTFSEYNACIDFTYSSTWSTDPDGIVLDIQLYPDTMPDVIVSRSISIVSVSATELVIKYSFGYIEKFRRL